MYKGHFKNERVIKPFRKHPKSKKFVCIKPSLQCMHNLYPFNRNSKMSRNSSSTDVCETLHSRRHLPKEYVAYLAFQKKMPNRAEIRFRAKTVVTSLPRDIYSDRPKNNIIIKFSLGKIVLQYRSIFFKYKRFKDEVCAYKNTGSISSRLVFNGKNCTPSAEGIVVTRLEKTTT